MLNHHQQSLRDVCAQIAPADEIDRRHEDASKEAAKELGSRKLAVLRAALALTATLAKESGADHKEIGRTYLASVSAYLKNPTAQAAEKVESAIGKSDLVEEVSEGVVQRRFHGQELRKAIFYTMKAATVSRPSEAAGYLHEVAMATVRHLEKGARVHSGVYHQTVAGLISGAALAVA